MVRFVELSAGPNPAPKLTLYTEYISRASRALAAMTLRDKHLPTKIAVHSGIEHETCIDGDRPVYWTATGWITVVIITCCILMGLVLVCCRVGRVADTASNGTQTLEEGECVQDISTRVMRQGRTLQK